MANKPIRPEELEQAAKLIPTPGELGEVRAALYRAASTIRDLQARLAEAEKRRVPQRYHGRLAMLCKPGDNRLGKRDTVTLAAYRDKIDPEGRGVEWSGQTAAKYAAWHCCVCGGPVRYPKGRVFVLKPRTPKDAFEAAQGLCEECHRAVCQQCADTTPAGGESEVTDV